MQTLGPQVMGKLQRFHCQCNDKVLLWRRAYSWHVGRNTKNIATNQQNPTNPRNGRHLHHIYPSFAFPWSLLEGTCMFWRVACCIPRLWRPHPVLCKLPQMGCRWSPRRSLLSLRSWRSEVISPAMHTCGDAWRVVLRGALCDAVAFWPPRAIRSFVTKLSMVVWSCCFRTNIHIIRVQSYRLHCFVEEIQHHLGDMMTSVVVSDLQGDFTTLKVILDICQVFCLRNVSTKAI